MEAFICSSCKAPHNWDDLVQSTVCDKCKLEIKGRSFDCDSCNNELDYDPDYHKECLVKVGREWACTAHAPIEQKRVDAGKIVDSYVRSFWGELGSSIKERSLLTSEHSFTVQFPSMDLQVAMTALNKTKDEIEDYANDGDLTAISYEITGIKNFGSSTYVAGIHAHEITQIEVASAIIRSIRSKKSNLTVVKNDEWDDMTRSEKIKHNRRVRDLTELSINLAKKVVALKEKIEKSIVETLSQPEAVATASV